jgi:sporulation protein YlmC with PRC-barrel domain
MIDQTHVQALYDCDVIDNRGEKIGSVKRVWLEDGTGTPMWAEVHTGLFGMKETSSRSSRARWRVARSPSPSPRSR